MGEAEVGAALRNTMIVVLKLGGPALICALLVGLTMSFIQAVTQINEATLAFVPKVLMICGVLALTGPFMLSTLTSYTQGLFDQLIEVGAK
jgi:flagellar biosynthetic protein FliQ